MSDSNPEDVAVSSAPEMANSAPVRKVSRKTRVGVVVSDKMTKTIVVNVERRVPHSQFGKIVKRSSRFYAHDESGVAKEGDKVLIEETLPKSKLKCWRLVEVLAH